MTEPTHINDPTALRAALEAVCDQRDTTLVQARIVMRDMPTIVVTACGPARSIDGAREVEIARSLAPALGEALLAFVQGVKDQELVEARALLARVVKYEREDRAVTPGTTRLARVCEEARAFLGEEVRDVG